MLTYPVTLAGLKRELPICPLSDDTSIAAFVIFGDAPLTVACAGELLRRAPEYDYLITAEAKGIPLAHEMAQQREDDYYFIARKMPKLYMRQALSFTYRSITTAREQTLYLDRYDAERMAGKRILLVDDVISTGESLLAVEHLVREAGGIPVGRMCILAEGDAIQREDITFLAPLPLFHPDGTPKG